MCMPKAPKNPPAVAPAPPPPPPRQAPAAPALSARDSDIENNRRGANVRRIGRSALRIPRTRGAGVQALRASGQGVQT